MNLAKICFLLFAPLALLITTVAWADVENPHGPLTVTCNSCHTTEGWTQMRPDMQFDHQRTKFPLMDRHVSVACIACHANPVFVEAGTACKDCHLDVHRGQFAQNSCEECHTQQTWNNQEQMLARHQQMRFPLVGVHASLDCQQCHANGQYVNVPVNCQGCHMATYQQTTSPAHAAAGFSIKCEDCHNIVAASWTDAKFTHAASFPLIAGHASPTCAACHTSGYVNTSSVCYDCHEASYTGASNPEHVNNQFSHDCAGCHTIDGWQPASFDHNLSGFPLTGAHATVDCAQCHANGQYTGASSACYDCHEAHYTGTTNPNHVAGNYDHNCSSCHSTDGWAPASFDHSQSAFPLTGAHVAVSCAECHVGGQYTGIPTACYSCHQQDYQNATEPEHAAAQFSQSCAECHTTSAWQPSTFSHDQTAFPLTGAHIAATCQACHVNGQYANTPTDCWACHQTDFEGAQDPNHVAGNLDHACAQCHTDIAWSPASFDHGGTDFPLTGAHVSLNCAQCHINGQFNNTPTDCWSCHQTHYEGATNPNHVSNQFSHDCAQCHTTAAWTPSTFDHNQTQFPLTGAHINANCASCHVNGQYQNTPTDCYACHQQDYDGVADPNHVSNQFSHACAECHTTAAWSPATFDHSQTQFPLTGAHVSVSCVACHVNGQYQNTPTACAFCHQADYNGSNNPNHQAAGFPTTCQDCHSTSGWTPAQFNHDQQWFPIYSGRHEGEWNTCADCHSNPNNFGEFTCITCHHQNDMDEEHSDVQGYVYQSSACYNCHPTGGGGGLRHPIPRSNQK